MTMPDKAQCKELGKVAAGVFFLVVFGFPISEMLYDAWQRSQKETVVPQIAGEINQPLFGHPNLEVEVWHQYPGDLKKGQLIVIIEGTTVPGPEGAASRLHSFGSWEPNRENGVDFTFPLTHFSPEEEISFKVSLVGENVKTIDREHAWLGDSWKSDKAGWWGR